MLGNKARALSFRIRAPQWHEQSTTLDNRCKSESLTHEMRMCENSDVRYL
jgi:hypothetical protein